MSRNTKGEARNDTDHISDQKLSLSVKPEDVRLITGPEDLYRWSRLVSSDHLFARHLSKHSIGAYSELYKNLEKTFEAVLNNPRDKVPIGNCDQTPAEREDSSELSLEDEATIRDCSRRTGVGSFTDVIELVTHEKELLIERCNVGEEAVQKSKQELELMTKRIQSLQSENVRLSHELDNMTKAFKAQHQSALYYQRRLTASEKALYIIGRTLDHARRHRQVELS